ncbi:MAG: DUF2786 domain-containing protein [Treponema socranskii subsp. buccale]
MNDTNIEIIKRKTKKLFALSKSPNEYEAASALQMATVLMEKYKIDSVQLHDIISKTCFGYAKDNYRDVLAYAMSMLYSVYRVKRVGKYWKSSERQIFYGEAFDVFMASEMYMYLIKTIERMARNNIRKNAKARYRESYKRGIASRLFDRICKLGQSVSWASEREATIKDIEAIVTQNLTVITGTKSAVPVQRNAFLRGAKDGEDINLSRQMTGSGGRYLE